MKEHARKHRGTIVDLFCGVGGFSLGAEMAGFRNLASVELDPIIHAGYRRNFPKTNAVLGSVADLDRAAWDTILGSARPDGVIGGPPCQGFSWIGKRRKDDPRNTLVHQFYRHVDLLRPKFFVMENVLGILDEGNIDILRDAIATLGGRYVVNEPLVVNAADFGAATNRKRVVVVGYDPDEMAPIGHADLVPRLPARRTTVRDAIADLPGPSGPRAAKNFEWIAYPPSESISAYAKRLRRPRPGAGSREASAKLRQGLVSGLMPTAHGPAVLERFRATPGGRAEPTSRSFRLEWDGLCPTIRAGTGMDKGAFQAVRPIHPDGERVITVREAARISGFPDAHLFSNTVWHSFRMIGNSVSPPLSSGLMSKVAEKMS
jgi:DNA (cytosine-5)-methyltransferase 1